MRAYLDAAMRCDSCGHNLMAWATDWRRPEYIYCSNRDCAEFAVRYEPSRVTLERATESQMTTISDQQQPRGSARNNLEEPTK